MISNCCIKSGPVHSHRKFPTCVDGLCNFCQKKNRNEEKNFFYHSFQNKIPIDKITSWLPTNMCFYRILLFLTMFDIKRNNSAAFLWMLFYNENKNKVNLLSRWFRRRYTCSLIIYLQYVYLKLALMFSLLIFLRMVSTAWEPL